MATVPGEAADAEVHDAGSHCVPGAVVGDGDSACRNPVKVRSSRGRTGASVGFIIVFPLLVGEVG